ncbi:MAG: gas vesicle protein GvpG [Chloroflexi bacterium]|nr:gas vesicle protein GvpG [Chloroflexota bacterium]
MGWLTNILLAPITGPLNTVLFVCEQVKERVDAELLDEGLVEDELVTLSLRYELGEIADEDYDAQEAALLERLNEIRAYKESLARPEDDVGDDGS